MELSMPQVGYKVQGWRLNDCNHLRLAVIILKYDMRWTLPSLESIYSCKQAERTKFSVFCVQSLRAEFLESASNLGNLNASNWSLCFPMFLVVFSSAECPVFIPFYLSLPVAKFFLFGKPVYSIWLSDVCMFKAVLLKQLTSLVPG